MPLFEHTDQISKWNANGFRRYDRHKYPMRYSEIIEGEASKKAENASNIWKQTQKYHEALRRLRSKQLDVQDAKSAARALPAGAERARRLKAADRKDSDARRIFGSAQSAAHDKITQTLSKRR